MILTLRSGPQIINEIKSIAAYAVMVVMQEEERTIYDGSSDGGNREEGSDLQVPFVEYLQSMFFHMDNFMRIHCVGWSMTISGLAGKQRQTVANVLMTLDSLFMLENRLIDDNTLLKDGFI
uniref:Uncharacterized protein n=1 Tax=Glossina austeni TaxID=7395 RepID=A0A1A9VBH4_GLOAU